MNQAQDSGGVAAEAVVHANPGAAPAALPAPVRLALWRVGRWLASPSPYLMLIGFALLFGFWHLSVEVWKLPRFSKMPGLVQVVREWLSPDPVYGVSIFTAEYYQHIWVSVKRVGVAFLLATGLGVPLGLMLGWSQRFREYVFPLFETLRPVPILAWVPISIVIFSGAETSVVFLTFVAAFFVTTLNTMVGVQQIDGAYVRAAQCLGASPKKIFIHVVIPGALPSIFTGLQIAVGISWFSLVAAEMVSGEYGLGYLINTAYTKIQYPTIAIGMITLGMVGYATSALVRLVGRWLTEWRERELGVRGS
jgi:NitT/TauT family transport system permease protein